MKSQLLLPLIFFCISLQAQEADLSIYFNSGSAILNQQAIVHLDNYILSSNQTSKLQIKAYTDEVGDESYNLKLAEKRAKAVEHYLIQAGYAPQQLTIEAKGELATKRDKQENRRVDIFVESKKLENLSQLFEEWQLEGYQNYEFSNLEDIEIKGAKGCYISIAAKSLVNKEGQSPKKVRIQLLEALDYGDMLRYQLSTTSGDQQLETGGMLELRAFDVETGEELALKTGAFADIRIPSASPMKEDMQLFLAEDRVQTRDLLNWQAQNQPFRSTPRLTQYTLDTLSISEASYKHKLDAADILTTKHLKELDLPKAIPSLAYPNPPKLVKPYQIKSIDKKSKETIIAAHPQKKRESQQAYEKRIQFLLKQQEQQIKIIERQNRYGLEQYTEATLQYEQDLHQYTKDSIQYAAYQKEIKALALVLHEQKEDILAYIEAIKNQSLAQGYDVQVGYIKEYFIQYKKLIEKRKIDAANKSLSKTMKLIAQNEEIFKTAQASLEQEIAIMQLLMKNCHFWKSINLEGRIKDEMDLAIFMLAKKEVLTSNEWQELEAAVQGLYKTIEKIENSQSSLMTNIHQMVKKVVEHSKEKFVTRIANVNRSRCNMEKVYFQELTDKGFMTGQMLKNAYINISRTQKLGWINCDRFMNYNGPKVQLVVEAPYREDTHFYLLFEDLNSILPLYGSQLGYTSRPIPLGQKVQLIGLSVRDGRPHFCRYNISLDQTKKLTPTFKETSLDELEARLAAF